AFVTQDYFEKDYELRMRLTSKEGISHTKSLNFSLVEYIPTFDILGEAGFQLKSIIQTYDDGYMTLSSDATNGTKVVKYDKEGLELWTKKIPATVGVGESVCEDIDYDKGFAIAGWRQNGTHKDTWVRKINHTDGGLIWNKHFGYDNVDDAATVIKRSIDDGFIVGGWTYNRWGTDSIIVIHDDPYRVVRTTLETGYDIRLLKIYSNGNEVWGYENNYSNSDWYDISMHYCMPSGEVWIRKMGDQVITDLIADENGNYLVTGWNNSRLYPGGTDKKDMYYAEVDMFGGFESTMTWSRMSLYDHLNPAGRTNVSDWRVTCGTYPANPLGSYSEDEIGYGIVKSQGGYGGDVVLAGEAYQRDDLPVKAKLKDGWVVDFGINEDEDGALWEYTFGEAENDDIVYGIDKTRDGCYIVTGYTNTTGSDKDTWLFKLDSQLLLLLSRNYGRTGDDDTGVKALQTSDGGYVVGGNTGTGASIRSRVIKVNKAGDLNKK
ncbi:MAG: hypothetical protein KKD38_08345, partial [Candidatus Delongbacteria bacterium]|nr:hypothetical protein [Candidatus Delongbacteria bacterium]MCG2760522.1 hypothetical protein [Candidatus Delongbacteria bacterium]